MISGSRGRFQMDLSNPNRTSGNYRNATLASIDAATITPTQFKKPVGGGVKRMFDLLLTSVGILFLLPILLLLSMAVSASSRGSIIVRHKRIGYRGEPFMWLKFRTMRPEATERLEEYPRENPDARAEWEQTHKLRADPRVTALGGIMRKTSLDELPQLFNVLLGDMSLVGPRPVTKDELDRYAGNASLYMSCKPGITGPWQISGRSSSAYDERVSLDAAYANNWSLARDTKIVVMTIPVLIGDRNAC